MADSLPDLTPQQLTFVEEYCKDRNTVRAALAANLSERYFAAAEAGRQLLKKPEIRAAVKFVFRTQAKRLKTEVPDIVREWAGIGRADITDYVVDDEGRVGVAPGVPRSALRAVKKVKQVRTERLSGRGESQELTVEVRTEIELHDKLSALAKLYEHLHGVLPGEKKDSGGGVPIEHAIEFAEFLARKRSVPGVVPGGVPVVPEDRPPESGVPQPGG